MSTSTTKTPPKSGRWAGPSRFRPAQDRGVLIFLILCTSVTVLTSAGILAVLGVETVRFFRASGVGILEFLTGTVMDAKADPPRYGILPLVWGTVMVALGSSLVALPIGLLSAIYLSEYAPRRVRQILKPTLELLAGVPTIVYGYLALVFVTPLLRATLESRAVTWLVGGIAGLFGTESDGLRVETFNALSACIVVGIMIIPLVSSLSEDVLSAVPRGLREAAYGLGATRFEVATKVVLPAGLSGVVASFILAISRAIGETMAVTLAAGSRPQMTWNPLTSIETMTAYIVAVTGGEAAAGSPEFLSLFAVGFVLFAITLAMNLLSGAILRRYREVVH